MAIYEWTDGARVDGDAQQVGSFIETNGGDITAERFLDLSRPASAPTHALFEWNDSIAAERYRLEQARYIIRHLCVREVGDTMFASPVRAFLTVENEDHEPRGRVYRPVAAIVADEAQRVAIAARYLREIGALQRRYAAFQHVAATFADTEAALAPLIAMTQVEQVGG